MKLRDFLENWKLSNLKLNLRFLEAEFAPSDADREAAWDLYVELLTRITTQRLTPGDGDEKAALDSIYSIFAETRGILRARGSGCGEFAKIAIPVLNQIVRPFTAKWHRLSLQNCFEDDQLNQEFRDELEELQEKLRQYTQALAAMAHVEDLTKLEAEKDGE